jgi:hypothetical protein
MEITPKKTPQNQQTTTPTHKKHNTKHKQFLITIWKRNKSKYQHPNCKKYGKQVHHITRWADNPLLRYNPINGILLCINHHKKITGKETVYAPIFRQIIFRKTK